MHCPAWKLEVKEFFKTVPTHRPLINITIISWAIYAIAIIFIKDAYYSYWASGIGMLILLLIYGLVRKC